MQYFPTEATIGRPKLLLLPLATFFILCCCLLPSSIQAEIASGESNQELQNSDNKMDIKYPNVEAPLQPGLQQPPYAPESSVYVPMPQPAGPPHQPVPTEVRGKRVKRQHAGRNDGFSVRSLVELLLCFFLPPAAVALHGGAHFKMHILLNVVLCVLGWIPGILHAVWYCFMSGF